MDATSARSWRPSGVVTLTTDFGLADAYVGVMHGVLLGRGVERVVDLTHGIAPQDVRAGAFQLSHAWRFFPPGTVHVAVVDPGVGSGRRILVAEAAGQAFLAPDNGLLGPVLEGLDPRVFALDAERFALPGTSRTFHGRDVFSPAAAALAGGLEPAASGEPAADYERLAFPGPSADPSGVRGEVLLVDRFGNLVTNVGAALLAGDHGGWRAHLAGRSVPLVGTYAEVAPGELAALVDSFGLVEVAVRDGSAARELGLGRGRGGPPRARGSHLRGRSVMKGTTARRVAMVGVPMDLGGGRRGVDMGPSAVRIAGVAERLRRLGLDFEDRGNVAVPAPESREPKDPRARFLSEIARACARLRARVERILEDGAFPLVVGGDHSIAVGTVAAISSWHHRQGRRIGLIWFDAHGDMNTPDTSPSGNVHGMPCAAIVGRGARELVELGARVPMVDAVRTVIVGVRDLDVHERDEIRTSGVRVFTMRDIDTLGMAEVMQRAIAIATEGTAGFHLSFDLDGTDPSVAPGVGTPVRGGTDFRESHLVMELAAETGQMLGLEMTEINPILDEKNRTAEVAVELVLSAMGKRIL